MSEVQHPEPGHHGVDIPPPPPEQMPKWIPVLIGVVLVALASLAVITGVRYRDNTLVNMVKARRTQQRAPAPAPPGEPEAGASLMFPGDSPQANEPVEGPSQAEISGTGSSVTAVVRMWARRGMQIKVAPADAVVYVNDVAVGQATQFDSENEIYDFAEPGSYDVKLRAPGFRERHFIVTAAGDAQEEVARIDVKLEKQ
jgi:hypothetical protein